MVSSRLTSLPITRKILFQFIFVLLSISIIAAFGSAPVLANSQAWNAAQPHRGFPRLADFIGSVQNGRFDTLVGVYVPGLMALPVLQQPSGNPAFVSNQPDTVTQFSLARDYGSIGLVAHNTHSGVEFYKLYPGQDVILVYGDGKTTSYRIKEKTSYQALSPNSPYSNFVDLGSGKILNASELFLKIYAQPDRLVFLTCIEANGISTWGRLFIIAEPFERRAELLEREYPEWAIPD
jgi:hypothetical protein